MGRARKALPPFTLPNDLNEYVRPIIAAHLPPEQEEMRRWSTTPERLGTGARSHLGEEVDADQLRATPLLLRSTDFCTMSLYHRNHRISSFEAEDRENEELR